MGNAAEFVHLHLHTEFSLLDGACRIGEMLDQVKALGMPAVAITEHGNLFSAITFTTRREHAGSSRSSDARCTSPTEAA